MGCGMRVSVLGNMSMHFRSLCVVFSHLLCIRIGITVTYRTETPTGTTYTDRSLEA